MNIEFEKAQKNLKNDMIVLIVLQLIIIGLSLYIGEFSVFSIVNLVGLFIVFVLSKKGSKLAGILGIFIGAFMMITIISGSIIDFLLGLFILLHSIRYNKSI